MQHATSRHRRPASEWRCSIASTPSDAFVVRVDQRDIDVVVSLLDASGRQAGAVDSPTKRASDEVLLAGPRLNGKYTLLVRAKSGVANAQRASLILERLDKSSALLAGLAELTLAAAPDEGQTAESGKNRIAQLHTALAKLQSTGAKEWQAEVLLRIAATYYWVVNDVAAASSSARLAMDAFSEIGDPVGRAQAAIIHAAAAMEIATATKAPRARGRAELAQSPLGQAVGLLDSQALVLQQAGLRYAQAQALNFAGVGLSIKAITALHARATSKRQRSSGHSAMRRAPHCHCRTSLISTTTAATTRPQSRASRLRSTSSIPLPMPGSTSRSSSTSLRRNT